MSRIENQFREQDFVAAFVDLDVDRTRVSLPARSDLGIALLGVCVTLGDGVPRSGTWRAVRSGAEIGLVGSKSLVEGAKG